MVRPVNEQNPAIARGAGAATVMIPRDKDVLFGRGKSFVRHGGNRLLHKLANEYRALYKEFGFKTVGIVDRKQKYGVGTKREIVNTIISKLQEQGCRFLRRDEDNEWEQVDMAEAQSKVSHLLRSKPVGSTVHEEEEGKPPARNLSNRPSKRPRRAEPWVGRAGHPASGPTGFGSSSDGPPIQFFSQVPHFSNPIPHPFVIQAGQPIIPHQSYWAAPNHSPFNHQGVPMDHEYRQRMHAASFSVTNLYSRALPLPSLQPRSLPAMPPSPLTLPTNLSRLVGEQNQAANIARLTGTTRSRSASEDHNVSSIKDRNRPL